MNAHLIPLSHTRRPRASSPLPPFRSCSGLTRNNMEGDIYMGMGAGAGGGYGSAGEAEPPHHEFTRAKRTAGCKDTKCPAKDITKDR
jgi:hypothetical protein